MVKYRLQDRHHRLGILRFILLGLTLGFWTVGIAMKFNTILFLTGGFILAIYFFLVLLVPPGEGNGTGPISKA